MVVEFRVGRMASVGERKVGISCYGEHAEWRGIEEQATRGGSRVAVGNGNGAPYAVLPAPW